MNASNVASKILAEYYGNGKIETIESITLRFAGIYEMDYSYLLGYVQSEIDDLNN